MESSLSEIDEEDHSRPTLLTVLCILTFIGSSWLIVTNIWAYGTASKTAAVISTVSKRQGNDSTFQKDSTKTKVIRKNHPLFGEKMMLSVAKIMTADNIRKNAAGTILSALITLFGALSMWWLKRKGFYIYIVGTLLGILIPLYFYGINMTSIGISFFPGFFGLVFIALYAVNFKSLR